jgi:hypothetical protein
METLGNDLVAKSGTKVAPKYYCEKCDYECSKIYNWKKHIGTTKHNLDIVGNDLVAKSGKKNKNYSCEKCEKYFNTNSGLWKHKKQCNCKQAEPDDKQIESNKDDLINYLIKENQEFKNLILEIVKKDTYNNNTINTHTNNISNNKTFNLNLFLNETCKDAMNIMDFVESIKLQLSDLERVGEIGYVEGISNIIIKNLKELDISQRPVHCTDKKREIIYIKDEDKWEKDEEQKKMHKVIKKVAAKNARMILKYKELHPDCNTYNSKYSDQYNKIIIEAMGGSGDNDLEKEEKIIKNISKQIGIVKE